MGDINISSFVYDVAARLQANGIGTIGAVVFRHRLPSSPSAAVAVLSAGGPAPIGAVLSYPRIQVLARDDTLDAALARAQAVFTLLDNAWVQMNSAYGRLTPDAELGGYFPDGQGRPVFSMNFSFDGHRPA